MSKKLFAILVIIGFIMGGAFKTQAQNVKVRAKPQTETYYLSFDDVSHLALLNNFDIQLAKFDTYIKRTDQDLAESIFDTIIDAEIKYKNDQKRRASAFAGTKEINNDFNFGITKKMSTGTSIGLDFDNNRNWSDSAFVTMTPAYSSSAKIGIEQELGKNFFGIKDRSNIKITKIDIENTEYTSLESIEQSLAKAQESYWGLVLSIELLKTREEMLTQAEKLYSLHQKKIKDGLVEEPELFASEANVRQRRTDILVAKNNLDTGKEELKLLLNIKSDIDTILPKDKLNLSLQKKSLEGSLSNAFKHRRDYLKEENNIKSKDIQLDIDKHNLWPEINLEASFAKNGIDDRFSQAMSQIGQESNPEYFLGVKISFPLENREAKSGFDKAKIEKAKALISIKKTERVILKEIVDGVRQCQVFYERAKNQKIIANLQEKKLKEEEKRFKYGRSNTDTIIRYQEDLLNAQLLAAQAVYEYKIALIDLSLKENTLLDRYWKDKI